MIRLEGLTREYGGARVVDDLTLDIPDGAVCALVGTSGSGKSTTLRTINRLVTPTAGRVLIDGEDVATLDAPALRRRIGYVIQSIGLFPHWNVGRNIGAVPRLLGWTRARTRDRTDELMALLALDPALAGRYPHELSGGQQQRVGVARALAADPAYLLMDEPFGALDPPTRAALQAELARIHAATGKTIVIVTHDMDEALLLGTLVAVLDRGRLAQAGAPRDLLRAPANDFVRNFLGGPEAGLRLLALTTARERARDEGAEGEPVPDDISLREALGTMAARGTDRLALRGGGSVRLADIARA